MDAEPLDRGPQRFLLDCRAHTNLEAFEFKWRDWQDRPLCFACGVYEIVHSLGSFIGGAIALTVPVLAGDVQAKRQSA